MGKGNCCVTGKNECLFYIDNDDFHVYVKYDAESKTYSESLLGDLHCSDLTSGEWVYDEVFTESELADILCEFKTAFCEMFPSFSPCEPDTWIKNGPFGDYTRKAILENKLFYVCVEDNQWSMAVELIQKEPKWGYCLEGLQSKHAPKLKEGMKSCLLERLGRLFVYSGPWTSGLITRD